MSEELNPLLLLTWGLCELALQLLNGLVEVYKSLPDRIIKELEVKE